MLRHTYVQDRLLVNTTLDAVNCDTTEPLAVGE